nr:CD225/dispanin family protein [uncultured Mediterraneibacter sp.]
MNCIKCYHEIEDGAKFCPHCGAQQPDEAGAETVTPQTETNAPIDAAAQQTETVAQPESSAPQAEAQPQTETQPNTETQTQYQDAQPQYGYTSDYQNSQPYQAQPTYQTGSEPDKQINWVPYLVLSIISTICCCIPFGIVAIVYSAKINSSVTTGDLAGAEKAAKTARIWIIVAFVVGFLANLILAISYGGLIGAGSYYYY